MNFFLPLFLLLPLLSSGVLCSTWQQDYGRALLKKCDDRSGFWIGEAEGGVETHIVEGTVKILN